jgi:sodium/proline symporter
VSPAVLAPFVIYLLVVLGIGVMSARLIKSYDDFMIGGRRLGPAVSSVALIASYMSGYTYTAGPGVAYSGGWSSMWWAFGDAPGNAFSFGVLGRRLRKYSELLGAITLPEYYEKRFKSPALRIITSIVMIVTVCMYLIAQWQASGHLLSVTFGTNYLTGLLIGAAVVLAYTVMGGYLAAAYTSFFQGIVMFVGTHVLFWLALARVGGLAGLNDRLAMINPGLVTPWGPNNEYGTLLAVLTPIILIILGSFGLPHVTVRHLSLTNPDAARKAMLISASFVVLFAFAYYMVGAIALAIFGPGVEAVETVGIRLWFEVLPPFVAGILAAAAVAAIMSTADGFLVLLITTCAHDLLYRFVSPKATQAQRITAARIFAAVLAVLTMIIAMDPPGLVFTIVIFAFGGMALAFGIPNLFSTFWKRSTETGAIACIVLSLAVYIGFSVLGIRPFGLHPFLPGLITAIAAFVIGSLVSKKPDPEMESLFDVGVAYGPLPANKVTASSALAAEAMEVEKVLKRGSTKNPLNQLVTQP